MRYNRTRFEHGDPFDVQHVETVERARGTPVLNWCESKRFRIMAKLGVCPTYEVPRLADHVN